MMIRLYEQYDEAVIERELGADDVASVVDRGSVWVRNDDGEVERLSPEEHPAFTTDRSVSSWHPDEGTVDDAAYAGPLGHIGELYFARWFDEGWFWLGSASSADEALDLLRGSLGVLDPSWIFFEP